MKIEQKYNDLPRGMVEIIRNLIQSDKAQLFIDCILDCLIEDLIKKEASKNADANRA